MAQIYDTDRMVRSETTDRRYIEVGEDAWWDTTGVEIVPESVVDAYMAANRVGVVRIAEWR